MPWLKSAIVVIAQLVTEREAEAPQPQVPRCVVGLV